MTWSADGNKHDRNALIGAASLLVGSCLSGHIFTGMVVSVTITVWGLYFSPDLDLSESGHWRGGACRAWHRWKRLRLGWFWKPYGMLFNHRGSCSHSLFPGTFIRILYVSLIPLLIGAGLHFGIIKLPDLNLGYLPKLPTIEFTWKFYQWLGRCFLSGCLIADGIHLWTDKILLKRLIVLS